MRNPSVNIGEWDRLILDILEKLDMVKVHEWAAEAGMGMETRYVVVIEL